MQKKWIELGMGVFILAAAYILGSAGGKMSTGSVPVSEQRKVIVLDAGHGGSDPGKVGINKALEKEVNLSITLKLKGLLEQKGIQVVMTRETDQGLYDEGTSNKKQQDMKKRCQVIDSAEPMFTVSVHQNSYSSESVHGPQVFYYSQSLEGQHIAEYIQKELNTSLSVDRPREIKSNDSYYLLKKTKKPTVIVECGFLSNTEEAGKLVTEEYQKKVAGAICNGIGEYIEKIK